MPELPEVETMRSGLEVLLADRPMIVNVKLMRADIRFPIPKELPARLRRQKLIGIRRRAKYLLFDTPKVTLLSHLGMTGSWRILKVGGEDPHDHCYIELSDGRTLSYRDPRRFGLLDLVEPGIEATHPRLKDLGVEPLVETAFDADFLFRVSRLRTSAIKTFLMDQRIVVGIGNIYASEALFRAGIRPARKTGRLTLAESVRIVHSSREILRAAILAGGSSIRDYRGASGEAGEFQRSHLVYERKGEPCVKCKTKIVAKVIGGRSSYWCPKCQI